MLYCLRSHERSSHKTRPLKLLRHRRLVNAEKDSGNAQVRTQPAIELPANRTGS